MEKLSLEGKYKVLMKGEVYLGIYLGINSRKTRLPHAILLNKSKGYLKFSIYRFKDFKIEKENIILKHPYPVEPTRNPEIKYYQNLLERILNQ